MQMSKLGIMKAVNGTARINDEVDIGTLNFKGQAFANIPTADSKRLGIRDDMKLENRQSSTMSRHSRTGSPLRQGQGQRSTSPPSNLNTLARQKVLVATLMSDLRQEDLDSVVGIIRVQDPYLQSGGVPDSFKHIALQEAKVHSFINHKGSPPSVAERLLSSRSPEARTVFICCEDHDSKQSLMLELICQLERNSHPTNIALRSALQASEERYAFLMDQFEALKKENESLCSAIIEVKERGAVYTTEYAKRLKQTSRILEFERKQRAKESYQPRYHFKILVIFKEWKRHTLKLKLMSELIELRKQRTVQQIYSSWILEVHRTLSVKYINIMARNLKRTPSIVSKMLDFSSKEAQRRVWVAWFSHIKRWRVQLKFFQQTVSRMQRLVVVKPLNAWRSNTGKQKRLRKACSRILQHLQTTSQRKAWNRWEEQIVLKRKCVRILQHIMCLTLLKAWKSWRFHLDRISEQVKLCHRVFKRMWNWILAKAWTQWRESTEAQLHLKAVQARTVSYFRNSILAKAWNKWLSDLNERDRFRKICTKVITFLKNRLLSKSWNTWHGSIVVKSRLQSAGLKVISRMRNLLLSKAWSSFVGQCGKQKRVEGLLQEAARTFQKSSLRKNIKMWFQMVCIEAGKDQTIFRWRRIAWCIAVQSMIKLTVGVAIDYRAEILRFQQICFLHFKVRLMSKCIQGIFRRWLEQTGKFRFVPGHLDRWQSVVYFSFRERVSKSVVAESFRSWMKCSVQRQCFRSGFRTFWSRRQNRILCLCFHMIMMHAERGKRLDEMDAAAKLKAATNILKRVVRVWRTIQQGNGYNTKLIFAATVAHMQRRLLSSFLSFKEYFYFKRKAQQARSRSCRQNVRSVLDQWKDYTLPRVREKQISAIVTNVLLVESRIRAQELSI